MAETIVFSRRLFIDGRTRLNLFIDHSGQLLKQETFVVIKASWFLVDHAYRPKGLTTRRMNRVTGVESDMHIAGDQRIVAETVVQGGIFDNQCGVRRYLAATSQKRFYSLSSLVCIMRRILPR